MSYGPLKCYSLSILSIWFVFCPNTKDVFTSYFTPCILHIHWEMFQIFMPNLWHQCYICVLAFLNIPPERMPKGHSYAIRGAHYTIWTGLVYMLGVEMSELCKRILVGAELVQSEPGFH